jgi:hypothetical protein
LRIASSGIYSSSLRRSRASSRSATPRAFSILLASAASFAAIVVSRALGVGGSTSRMMRWISR